MKITQIRILNAQRVSAVPTMPQITITADVDDGDSIETATDSIQKIAVDIANGMHSLEIRLSFGREIEDL